MAANLIVSDEYINDMADYFKEQGQNYNSMLTAYRNIVHDMIENGIKKGRIHDVLTTYIEATNCIEGEMKLISLSINQKLKSFIDEIDAKDKYI